MLKQIKKNLKDKLSRLTSTLARKTDHLLFLAVVLLRPLKNSGAVA